MTFQNAAEFLARLARQTSRALHAILNAIAESDRRYREELRLRGVSEDYLKDAGLTRRQLETAYHKESAFGLRLRGRSRASATPAE